MNSAAVAERVVEMQWHGIVWDFMRDTTRYLDLEGAFRSGKTTAACWKVFASCVSSPGIHWLICRYGDGDTKSKLKPVFAAVCDQGGQVLTWHPDEHYYEFANGSRVYVMGLKAQDQVSRYAKLRGLTLAGIYVDQAEELPYDVYLELKGRLSQSGHAHQAIFTPNPPEHDHWLTREFPDDNRNRGHHYYCVSVYDNEHNLPPETIPGLLEAYPPGHVKHGPAVLGLRGLNVIGQPVYGALDPRQPESAAFQRDRHERPLEMDRTLPLYEALDFGKHHPCVVWAQYTPWSELRILGGVMGQNLFLEDFAPIVQQYRARWFPDPLEVATCCDPAGSHNNSQGVRSNGVEVLRSLGFAPAWKADSNTPDVRVAMVERIAGYMRRRTPQGEAFGVDATRWMRITPSAVVPHRFLADGFQAGYVWDEHMVSVGNKQVRKPKKDGWYEHGQNCLEYLEHHFGGVQPTLEQATKRAVSIQQRALKDRQRDFDSYDQMRRMGQRGRFGRGGY